MSRPHESEGHDVLAGHQEDQRQKVSEDQGQLTQVGTQPVPAVGADVGWALVTLIDNCNSSGE